MHTTAAYAAHKPKGKVSPFSIERREPGPYDVQIDIEYCGVCHTDLHFVNNDWGMSEYPIVPGHEIVGRVSAVGEMVQKYKEGDLAAIGCMVNSCGSCQSCKEGNEQYCLAGMTATYNSPSEDASGVTYGGYSKRIVAHESYVLEMPESLKIEGTAPLLCAGTTT